MMKTLKIALAIKNADGAAIVSIYDTLIVSDLGSGFVSILREEAKKDEKEGVGFCPENAVFDWLRKNYITEEIFFVDDEVRLNDARFHGSLGIPYSESYTVAGIMNVSTITAEWATDELSAFESGKIFDGEDPKDLYGCSQLIKLFLFGKEIGNERNGKKWFLASDFTKAPM